MGRTTSFESSNWLPGMMAGVGIDSSYSTKMGSSKSPETVMVGGGRRHGRTVDNQVLKCPRCESTHTKFCYYNNYSLSQPRYFCKTCRRYWTKGGTIRNIPVGGGCRKTPRKHLLSLRRLGNCCPLMLENDDALRTHLKPTLNNCEEPKIAECSVAKGRIRKCVREVDHGSRLQNLTSGPKNIPTGLIILGPNQHKSIPLKSAFLQPK